MRQIINATTTQNSAEAANTVNQALRRVLPERLTLVLLAGKPGSTVSLVVIVFDNHSQQND